MESQRARNLQNGDVFIAIKGHNVDSHNFINSKMESQTSLIINEMKSSENIIKVDSSKDMLKRIAKKDHVEIVRISSGDQKRSNALKLLENAVYNIDHGNFIKNKASCQRCPVWKTLCEG